MLFEKCVKMCGMLAGTAGWLFLDSSTSMFVNARSRVYRYPQNKKKMKMGLEADAKQPTVATGNGR